ncbi:hypothetical protein HGRIS_012209 [Hohenbuehelia grisea]|uniref:UspA domain-containing protein n=1 Tax=Hohenbuehelia grisea TaxID=104357 RepID=A0ABR3IRL7_9AGAR
MSESPYSAHTHQPLPPLRSALKTSRPNTPASATLPPPTSDSPFITRIPLADSTTPGPPSPNVLGGSSPLPPISSNRLRSQAPPPLTSNGGSLGLSFGPQSSQSQITPTQGGHVPSPSPSPSLLGLSSSLPHGLLSPSPSIAAQGYTPKVSFDTFENPVASMFSFTLQVKSEGYKRTRSTRVFLCAASADESGNEALDWALESLVQDGDELIVCRGVEEEVLEKDHDLIRAEARELMRQIQAKSADSDADRKLSLILEYIPGKITDTLDRLIALYRPDSVVVGTRGRSVWQNMGIGAAVGMGNVGVGSVSKYCLSHSPVPVIVVRPERKVRKAVEKRRNDPKRGRHFDGDIKAPAMNRSSPVARTAPVPLSTSPTSTVSLSSPPLSATTPVATVPSQVLGGNTPEPNQS